MDGNKNTTEFSISSDYLVPDVENKEDYLKYKIRVFKTVPVNVALVCKNKFTGNVTSCSQGFKIIFPWLSSKLISLASKTVDYPDDVYKTKDGIEVTIDFALTIKIVDPVAFEVNSQNPLQEVGVLAMDLMRSYVARIDAETLYRSTIDLRDIDPTGQLHQNASLTGVDVTRFYVKNIELPQTMKDDFERKVTAVKENEIAQIQAETVRTQANAEAESAKIKATANVEVRIAELRQMIQILADSGCTKEQIVEYLKSSQFANGTAQVIANLNSRSSDSSALSAASIVAGAVRNGQQQSVLNGDGTLQEQGPVRARGR